VIKAAAVSCCEQVVQLLNFMKFTGLCSTAAAVTGHQGRRLRLALHGHYVIVLRFDAYICCFCRAVTGVQSGVQFRVRFTSRCPVRYWTCPCPVPTGHTKCHVQLHNMWLDKLTGHAGYHSAPLRELEEYRLRRMRMIRFMLCYLSAHYAWLISILILV
jgi:hypothetical protein